MNIFEIDKEYIAGTYKRFPVEIVSGKGSVVTDVNGKEYIDMGTGIAVNSFGIADDATAIKNVTVEAAENAAIYNVAGQRVNATYKGIVIKNGKKYLNK